MGIGYRIEGIPHPEFDGYPWHDPGTDPTQYFITLTADEFKYAFVDIVWVLWPSGHVYAVSMDGKNDDIIGYVTQAEHDGEPHTWMFQPVENMLAPAMEELIDAIVSEFVHEWLELAEPDCSILRPPFE